MRAERDKLILTSIHLIYQTGYLFHLLLSNRRFTCQGVTPHTLPIRRPQQIRKPRRSCLLILYRQVIKQAIIIFYDLIWLSERRLLRHQPLPIFRKRTIFNLIATSIYVLMETFQFWIIIITWLLYRLLQWISNRSLWRYRLHFEYDFPLFIQYSFEFFTWTCLVGLLLLTIINYRIKLIISELISERFIGAGSLLNERTALLSTESLEGISCFTDIWTLNNTRIRHILKNAIFTHLFSLQKWFK